MARTNKKAVNREVLAGLGTPRGFKAETKDLIKKAEEKELHEANGQPASAEQIIKKARDILENELKKPHTEKERTRITKEIKVLDKPGMFNTQLDVAHKYIKKYKTPQIEAQIRKEQNDKYIAGAKDKAAALWKEGSTLRSLSGDGLVNTLLDKKTFRRNGVYNQNKFKALPPEVRNAFSAETFKSPNFRALNTKQKTKVFDTALKVGKATRDSTSMGTVFKEMINFLEGPQTKKDGKPLTDKERVQLYDRYFRSTRTLTGKKPAAISQLKSQDRGEVYGHLFKSNQFSKLQPEFAKQQIKSIRQSAAFKNMADKDKLHSYGALLDNLHKNKALTPKDIATTYKSLVSTKEGSLNPFKKETAYDKMSPENKAKLFSKMLNSESFGSLSPKQQRNTITKVTNTTAFKKLDSAGKAEVYSNYLSGANFGKLTPKEQRKTLDKLLNSKGFKSLEPHHKVNVITKYMESDNLKVTDKFTAKDQRKAVGAILESDRLKHRTQKQKTEVLSAFVTSKNFAPSDKLTPKEQRKTVGAILESSAFRGINSKNKAEVLTKYVGSDNFKNLGTDGKKTGKDNAKYKAITNILSTTHNGKKVFDKMFSADRANVMNHMVDGSKDADPKTKDAIAKRLVQGTLVQRTRFQESPIHKIASQNPEEAAKIFNNLLSDDFTKGMSPEQKAKHSERIVGCKAFKKLPPDKAFEILDKSNVSPEKYAKAALKTLNSSQFKTQLIHSDKNRADYIAKAFSKAGNEEQQFEFLKKAIKTEAFAGMSHKAQQELYNDLSSKLSPKHQREMNQLVNKTGENVNISPPAPPLPSSKPAGISTHTTAPQQTSQQPTVSSNISTSTTQPPPPPKPVAISTTAAASRPAQPTQQPPSAGSLFTQRAQPQGPSTQQSKATQIASDMTGVDFAAVTKKAEAGAQQGGLGGMFNQDKDKKSMKESAEADSYRAAGGAVTAASLAADVVTTAATVAGVVAAPVSLGIAAAGATVLAAKHFLTGDDDDKKKDGTQQPGQQAAQQPPSAGNLFAQKAQQQSATQRAGVGAQQEGLGGMFNPHQDTKATENSAGEAGRDGTEGSNLMTKLQLLVSAANIFVDAEIVGGNITPPETALTSLSPSSSDTVYKVALGADATEFTALAAGSLLGDDNNKNKNVTQNVQSPPPPPSQSYPVTTNATYNGVQIPAEYIHVLSQHGCTTATNSNLQSQLSPSAVPKVVGVGQSVGAVR